MKFKAGDKIMSRKTKSVQGKLLSLPEPGAKFTHIQFRRWTGCPICNFHIAQFRRRADTIKEAGIHEIIYFHSTPEEIAEFQADVPFDMVGDPTKQVYAEFGVETSLKFAFSFKAIWAALRGLVSGHFNLNMKNGPLGLPADFLISPDGRIVAAKYGSDAYDQWGVDELLSIAHSVGK